MSHDMSSYERTLSALKRQQPDRVPVFCFCDQDSPGASEGFRKYVASHADVFSSRILYTGFQCTGLEPAKSERTLDEGWTETVYRFETGLQLNEVSKSGEKGDYIGYRKHVIGSREDMEAILKLPSVPPAGNPRLTAWITEMETAAASYCTHGAFFRIAFLGPLGTLAGAMSPADFAILAMEEEALVRRYMDVVLERQADYIDFILSKLSVPAIMNIGGAEYAIPPLMAPTAFAELIAPYDGKLIQLMHRHGRLVYYHSHGKVRQFLPQFISMGADGIHPLEPVGTTGDCDLAEVKREFGRDICLIGNIQYDDLTRLSASRVEGLVQEVAAVGKPGGGFILSPSCTPYHNPMPAAVEENIIAFIEAGLRYGAS